MSTAPATVAVAAASTAAASASTETSDSTATPQTTRAAGRARYGGPEVVGVREDQALPDLGPRDVLVSVAAAGLDRGVWHLMTGLPRLIRIAGFGVRSPKRFTLGMDVAGTVVAVGAEVGRFAPGDEVFGIGAGTFATLAVAPEAKLVHRPERIPVDQAGGAAISGLTAIQAIHDHGRVQPGHRVLVMGASGGVGSFAVQFAAAAGAEVTGVASAAKADFVRSLGATHVVDYRATDVTESGERYDVVIDVGGLQPVRRLRRILAPTGTLVLVGGEGGGSWTGGVGRQLRAKVRSLFTRQRLTFFVSPESLRDLERLRDAMLAGDVTTAVTGRYSLDQVAQAMEDLEDGRLAGKVVVVP